MTRASGPDVGKFACDTLVRLSGTSGNEVIQIHGLPSRLVVEFLSMAQFMVKTSSQ